MFSGLDLSWNTAIQALIIAVSTWYVRRGSKRDSAVVKNTAEIQISTMDQILDRLSHLELDMRLVKGSFLKEPEVNLNETTKGRSHGKSI